jgi:hypothetical protein
VRSEATLAAVPSHMPVERLEKDVLMIYDQQGSSNLLVRQSQFFLVDAGCIQGHSLSHLRRFRD